MTDVEVPGWCRWRRGDGAVLVVAPHGGRRDPVATATSTRPGAVRKVNDLHTADLADELATALGGSLIVNPALDRNRLDLNRISQVSGRARWFLVLIERLVDAILTRHARAELLFVHGWNVIQARCDIGIGLPLTDAAAASSCGGVLTVSPAYATQRLALLQARCAAAGIAASFGERYPARHPNNLLQLFRHSDPSPHTPPRVAAWTAAGRVEAVQLELGVPVRWPGRLRGAFVHATREAFGDAEPEPAGGALAPATAGLPSSSAVQVAHPGPASPPGTVPRPASLQLYDPVSDVALTARLESVDAPSDGRLLIFVGTRRLALFIGEDVYAGRTFSDGPHFTPAGSGFRVRFAGAALAGGDGTLYRDLEQAFAASHLCDVALDVSFRPTLSADYGVAEGWVELDGLRHPLATHGFARHGVLSGSPASRWTSQVILSAAFGAAGALRLRHEFPGCGELRHLSGDGEAVRGVRAVTIGFDGDRYSPTHITVSDAALLCAPRTRMAIVRPLLPHRRARVTFGAARFTCAGQDGFGFYEYARAVD